MGCKVRRQVRFHQVHQMPNLEPQRAHGNASALASLLGDRISLLDSTLQVGQSGRSLKSALAGDT
jgi:hypothetical protein